MGVVTPFYTKINITIPGTASLSWEYTTTGVSITGAPNNVSQIAIPRELLDLRVKSTSLSTVNVTSIGASAFAGQTNLTQVTFTSPSNVHTIGSSAFVNCTSLSQVSIPASVESIGSSAFYGCAGLADISFGAGSQLIWIGESAFEYCAALTGITLPPSVESIGEFAFYCCTGLESIAIPASVLGELDCVFWGCSGLTGIYVNAGNPNYASRDGILYNKAETRIIHVPDAVSGSVEIPSSMTDIEDSVFAACAGLTSITIPDSVESIGSSAFRHCTGLASIEFGAGSGLESIGAYAFANCVGLTGIRIPGSVAYIGDGAFLNCSGLTAVYIERPAPDITALGDNVFNVFYLHAIYVPDYTSEAAYKNAADWQDYFFQIETDKPYFPSTSGLSYTLVDGSYYAVSRGSAYTGTVYIPVAHNGIFVRAIASCGNLTSVRIPGSVERNDIIEDYLTTKQQ
jgi:hypothetical protein